MSPVCTGAAAPAAVILLCLCLWFYLWLGRLLGVGSLGFDVELVADLLQGGQGADVSPVY